MTTKNASPELKGLAIKLNQEQEEKRRAQINDPDYVIEVVDRGAKRRKHPEIFKLDTVAILAADAAEQNRRAAAPVEVQEDEFPLLRAFAAGIAFTTGLVMLAEIIVYFLG